MPMQLLNKIMDLFCQLAGMLPLECMQFTFMQEAFWAIVILSPLAASAGIQVVNFRMSFFSDAIGHSVFAGVALGLLLSVSTTLSTAVLALLVGLGIMAMKRRSNLSSDTVIGVFYSAVAALGLALVSRNQSIAGNMQGFLYGDILTITRSEIGLLFLLGIVFFLFQIFAFNALMSIGLNEQLAKAHRIKTGLYQYSYVALLALIVIFSVKACGVLLVTALLIVPSAAARNVAESARGMFFLAALFGLVSGIGGLLLSAQEKIAASSGATIVLVSSLLFLGTMFRRKKKRS